MITKLSSKPEVFNHLEGEHLWFRLGFDTCSCQYAYVALQFKHDEGLIHVEVTRWTPSVVTQAKKDWEGILEICKENGCRLLVAANPSSEHFREWTKFIGMFGFPEPQLIMISQREI